MTRLKVLAAVFIWGAAFAFTKRALSELSPLALTLMRSGLGSLTMLLWARTPGLFRAMRPKEWLQLGAIALSGVVGQQLIQAYALRGTSANPCLHSTMQSLPFPMPTVKSPAAHGRLSDKSAF